MWLYKQFGICSIVVSLYTFLCKYLKLHNNGPRGAETRKGQTVDN